MAFRTNKTPVLQEKSASGSVATFNTALAMPLASCKIAVNAWQEGSGTPSPDNVRTINGYSAIHIGNISDNTNINFFQGLLNGTYGFVDLGTLNWGYSNSVFNSNAIPTLNSPTNNIICPLYETTPYNIPSVNMPDKSIKCYGGSENKIIYIKDSNYTDAAVFTTAMSGIYLIYELKTPTTPTITDTQFDTLLTAFGVSGSMFTIQIGSTVYGGEYDARTGVLTVTQVKEILRGSYFSTYSASIQCAVGGKPAGWLPWLKQTGGSCEMLSHGLPTARSDIGNVSNGCFIGDTTGGNQDAMFIKFAGYSSLEDIQALIEAQYNSNTPVEVVYELATPTTIQLPPCPIDTLEGVNNIFADTGDVDLTYKDLDIAKRGNFREVFKLPS